MLEIRRKPANEDRPATRISLNLDGEEVSHLTILDLRMRVAGTAVRCGGIGGVGTNQAHRGKGYARRVLNDGVAYMTEQGFHLSALFGIADFYDRFGFASAFVECENHIRTRNAERAQACLDVRPFQPGDARAIVRIYEAMHADRSGSIVREPTTWTGFRRGSHWSDLVSAFVVLQAEEIVGYASYDLHPFRATFTEVGYTTPAAFGTILAEAARIAWDRRLEEVVVLGPPDDAFVRYCRRYGCEVRITYPYCQNGMARVIDQKGLLEVIRPALASRLQSAGAWDGTLVISTDLGTDRLQFGRGTTTLQVEMPQWMLAQLVLGYRGPEEAAFESELLTNAEALDLLRILFPEEYPYVHWSDRF